jgi:3-hydroxyisobutyrate dehydrogenase/2-hydroxy-3-oxopropionate reductase
MGSRIARRLLDAGHVLTVWNRTPEKADELVASGATRAETPAQAAAVAELVVTLVSNPEALQSVTEGEAGVAAGVSAGTTLLEMSTVGPDSVLRLRNVLPPDVELLDAPVLGSTGEAESGTLRIFVGGSRAGFERARPILSMLGTPMNVGELGAGAAAKLVANSTLFGVLATLGEALVLAEALGLEQDVAFEVLSATPVAAQAERRRESVESGEYPPRFALALARKDADLLMDAAASTGLELPAADAARHWLTAAEAAGLGDRDYSAVLAHILRERVSPAEPA